MPTNTARQKQKLIQELVKARGSLLEAAEEFSVEQQDRVFLGDWSIKDLLAHLAGWDYTNLQAVEQILAGQAPAFFQYFDKDWQSYNRELVLKYRRDPYERLLADVEASHGKLVAFLQALSPEEVLMGKVRTKPGRTVSIRSLLRAESRDEIEHARQVRTFLEAEKEKNKI